MRRVAVVLCAFAMVLVLGTPEAVALHRKGLLFPQQHTILGTLGAGAGMGPATSPTGDGVAVAGPATGLDWGPFFEHQTCAVAQQTRGHTSCYHGVGALAYSVQQGLTDVERTWLRVHVDFEDTPGFADPPGLDEDSGFLRVSLDTDGDGRSDTDLTAGEPLFDGETREWDVPPGGFSVILHAFQSVEARTITMVYQDLNH